MTKPKPGKPYKIAFRPLPLTSGRPKHKTVIAVSKKQAEKTFLKMMDFEKTDVQIGSITERKNQSAKARPKTRPGGKKSTKERIETQLGKAEEIHDPGPPEDACSASAGKDGQSPGDKQTGASDLDSAPDKLTPSEWDILRGCARLDENDKDNGKRLLAWFGDTVLHVNEGGWHHWTGTHWDIETGTHAIERQAHLVSDLIKREAALLTATPADAEIAKAAIEAGEIDSALRTPEMADAIKDAAGAIKYLKQRRAARFKFGTRSGDRARTRAMIDQAEPHQSVLPALLDQDDFALNVKNGTLRFFMAEDEESDPDDPRFICNVRLDKHDPADRITKLCDVKYDPDATAPIWLADLARFQPDEGTRKFLQVFMGYTVLGVTGEQVYGFFYGDGANWKSAFLQSIARTVGSYHKPQSYTSVSGHNMPTGDKPSPDWARLPGVRFLTIEEVPRKEPIREELIKMVTSGSAMPVRHLNKGMFDLHPSFTCIMTSNAEPNIAGHDKGIWRRTLIVPWDETISEAERLPFERVMEIYDKERAGILNWLIEGVRLYRQEGLLSFVTDRMRDFSATVRTDRDSAGSFVEDCVEHCTGEHITTRQLHDAYKAWCEANGVDPPLNSTGFGRQVKRSMVGNRTMEQRKNKVQGIRRFNDCRLHDVPWNPNAA